ncbi:major facilitator superfamily transporter protein [Lasallia pustulata]|uniref:Major facilitator superfamily transporter protein n=1 Tax=Lasallia pustulata TaxID=136370 RepID=A0A1W5DE73_9LECA|nr:major facilitator superfamily transporter protein [Lasallia pustulata]
MSLHRVGSISSYEQVRGASPARSEHRKMSFNPVGSWVPPAAQEQPVGAFSVSRGKRILQVILAVIYCLFAAGIVFGYAAIKPVLVKEGVYSDRCSSEESDIGEGTCYEQELRLNLMFTTAAVGTNVVALPVGTLLDRYGPRVSGITGSIFIAIGALLFAFAPQLPFDGYIPGYLFLALGGPFVFISSFQLSNTFPTHSGLILALLTGAFDSSSALFLVFRLIYSASNGTFTTQKFFLIYLIVPLFIIFVQLFVMPSRSYKTVGELVVQAEDPSNDVDPADGDISDDERLSRIREERRMHRESVVSEITSLLGKGADKQQKKEEKKKQKSGVWGALHGRTALQQIKTPWFWLITLFTVVQMTRINYFVATVRPQYEHLLGSYELAEHVNHVFDVALPVGGILSIPFIGIVLDHTSTPFVLGLLVTIATAIGIFGVLPYLWAAYLNVALFVLYRPFYYTAVSDYTAKVFGFHTFGKVYGLIICLAGMFNFIQSALDALTHKAFGGDPVPVDVILLSTAFIVGLALVSFVGYQSRHMARDHLEEEAEEATEEMIPAAAGGAS